MRWGKKMEVVKGQEFDLPLDVREGAEVTAVAFHPDKPVVYIAVGEHLFGIPLTLSPPPPDPNVFIGGGEKK